MLVVPPAGRAAEAAQSMLATIPCAPAFTEEAAATSARPSSASAGDNVLTLRSSSRAQDSRVGHAPPTRDRNSR